MGIDVGDAVLTFLGDTTQLHQAFQQVGADATQNLTEVAAPAMTNLGTVFSREGGRAAESSVRLKAAQAELRDTLAAVTKEGGYTIENLLRLTKAEQDLTLAASEAKLAHAGLRDALIPVAPAAHKAGAEMGFFAETFGEAQAMMFKMLGAIAVVEMIKDFSTEVVHSIVELDNLSVKSGIAIQTLAGLEHVAKENGVSFEQVSTAVTKLGRAHTMALEGNKQMIEAFHRIGIEIEELKTIKPEDLFFRVAEGMHHAKNAGDAVASSQTLMGRSASAMIPIFAHETEELRKMVEEAGRNSGVTKEAAASARDWEKVTADLGQAFRAAAIPAMQAALPLMRLLIELGADTWLVFKELGTIIYSASAAIIHSVSGVGSILYDLINRDFVKLAADSKIVSDKLSGDWNVFTTQLKNNYLDTVNTIKNTWKDAEPLQPLNQDLTDTSAHAKKVGKDIAATLKAVMEADIAGAERDRAENQLLYDQKKINATQWEHLEIMAAQRVNAAHAKYFSDLIAAYQKVGAAQKVKLVEQERDAQLTKDGTAAIHAADAAQKSLNEEEKKFGKLSDEAIKGNVKGMKDFNDEMLKAKVADPWPPQAASLVKLLTVLRAAGVEFTKLRQDIDAAQKAEKALDDAGLKGGKLWLEMRKKELIATIALMQAEGKATKQEIHDLQQIEHELKKFDVQMKDNRKSMADMTQEMKQDIGQFALDVGDAFAAVLQGTMSFSQAMEQAIGKLIGNMAKHWADYFMAMAIADMFFDPARAAAELAAAAALEMVGSLASSLGGGSSSSSGKSSAPQVGGSAAVYQPAASGQQPTAAPADVPHFAAGGLITQRTLAVVGESSSGSDAVEGVIPLHDRRAMRMIGDAIADAMHASAGGGIVVNVKGMISSDNLHRVVRKMSREVQRGNVRFNSTSTSRLTRKS